MLLRLFQQRYQIVPTCNHVEQVILCECLLQFFETLHSLFHLISDPCGLGYIPKKRFFMNKALSTGTELVLGVIERSGLS